MLAGCTCRIPRYFAKLFGAVRPEIKPSISFRGFALFA